MYGAWSPEVWTAVGTLATAVVALLAAGFAGWQVREIRRTRQEETRPFVIVDIQSSTASSNFLNLVIENAGATVARDVRLSFSPPLRSSKDSVDLESTALISDGIPMLPPGRRVTAFFDVSHERISQGLPLRYDVEVALKDYRGRPQDVQPYIIDLEHLYGLTTITEYGIHDAAKALREIQKSVKKWTDIHGRLKVWVRDEDRSQLDERIEHDLTGGYPTLGSRRPPELLMVAGRNALVRALYRVRRRTARRLRPAPES